MGRIKKAVGFVLRSIDFGESDRIVTVLSREVGKISLLAKGARKTESRFGAALELLNLSEFIYYHREGLKFLSQADILDAFPQLKGDYERLSTALRCARWIHRLLEEEHAEERIFSLFHQLLEVLKSQEGTAIYELAFKLKLLACLGLAPRLDRCTVCSRLLNEQSWFSYEKGGMICQRCHAGKGAQGQGVLLDRGTCRGLYMALRLPFSKLKRLRLPEEVITIGERVIEEFIAHHLRPLARTRRAIQRG